MAMLSVSSSFISLPVNFKIQKVDLVKPDKKWHPNFLIKSQKGSSKSGNSDGSSSNRKVWRRRKLAKKDENLDYRMERIPFLEEQVQKIKDTGKLLTMDIERLLLSEENRFAFVNEVAAEAKQYVENNRDEYGSKKAILHVLSNRMNDAGYYRPDGYIEDDPFKPGPGYLRDQL